jgi:hypothetical protein
MALRPEIRRIAVELYHLHRLDAHGRCCAAHEARVRSPPNPAHAHDHSHAPGRDRRENEPTWSATDKRAWPRTCGQGPRRSPSPPPTAPTPAVTG